MSNKTTPQPTPSTSKAGATKNLQSNDPTTIQAVNLNHVVYPLEDTNAIKDVMYSNHTFYKSFRGVNIPFASVDNKAISGSNNPVDSNSLFQEKQTRENEIEQLSNTIEQLSNTIANCLALPAITNLNITITSSGVGRLYTQSFASTATNAPVATAGFVMTHCMSTTSAMQTAYCGKQIFTRTLSGTTWSAWVAMWNTEES